MNKKKSDVFSNSSIKVPFFLPNISNSDKKAVLEALNSPLLTDGPKLRQFESQFAKFTGAQYTIGMSNATSSLHLSLMALNLKKNDEVIIPNETFVATANAVLLAGATPVIADIEETSYNISVESIERNITAKTKAILPVHIAGKACDIIKIQKLAKKNDLFLIEDCAHAIGTKIDGKHVGTFGDAGCFSFYPTKNMTTIEGGMVITNSKKIAEFVRSARNHGLTRSLSQRFTKGKPWNYDVINPGYNYRLDEIRSSLGISQLKRLKKLNNKRKHAYHYYNKKLGEIPGIILPSSSLKEDNVFHLYMIRVTKNYGHSRDELFKHLMNLGIRTSLHYKPLHTFSAYKKLAKIRDPLVNSRKLYKEIISLPFYPDISKKEQDYVIKSINEFRK